MVTDISLRSLRIVASVAFKWIVQMDTDNSFLPIAIGTAFKRQMIPSSIISPFRSNRDLFCPNYHYTRIPYH